MNYTSHIGAKREGNISFLYIFFCLYIYLYIFAFCLFHFLNSRKNLQCVANTDLNWWWTWSLQFLLQNPMYSIKWKYFLFFISLLFIWSLKKFSFLSIYLFIRFILLLLYSQLSLYPITFHNEALNRTHTIRLWLKFKSVHKLCQYWIYFLNWKMEIKLF